MIRKDKLIIPALLALCAMPGYAQETTDSIASPGKPENMLTKWWKSAIAVHSVWRNPPHRFLLSTMKSLTNGALRTSEIRSLVTVQV